MAKWLGLVVGIIFFSQLQAQDSLGNLVELQRLLNERKVRFSDYFESMEKRSGIFGNKTKRDLELSRQILLEIVTTDNRIFDELNRAIQRRGIAKASYTNDMIQDQETIDRLRAATDTLNKQLISVREANADLLRNVHRSRLIQYLLSGALVLYVLRILYLRRIRRRSSQP